MGAFRLMLCLAGLAIYVVIKQFTVGTTDQEFEPRKPAVSPSSGQLTPPKSGERGPKPQTEPHTGVLKKEKALAARSSI